jgi:hypothetical protein
MGTLIRLAIGFDSFLASSAAAACSSLAASCATRVVVKASAQASAAAMRFDFIVVFTGHCFQILSALNGLVLFSRRAGGIRIFQTLMGDPFKLHDALRLI